MPTSETITLDPSEAILGREEFDITNWIDQDGIDWGEASIEPIMAEKDRGDTPVDFRLPNREITAGLSLVNRGTVTAIQARTKFQAKVSLFQKEGGVIRRVTNGGGTVYADVVDASIAVGSPVGYESAQDIEIEGAAITFVCLPDFYEAEVDLGDNTETTLPELIWEETSISGDYPARCRIVVDNDEAAGTDWRGLLWGFRSRHYSSADTAALAYQAEELDAIGAGTITAVSGASGGTAVKVAPLWPAWSSVLKTTLGGTAELTHTGSYRVFARCRTMGIAATQARLTWNVNDLVNPIANDPWTFPNPAGGGGTVAGTAWHIADLGEVRLDPSPVGTHRWMGQIDAQTYNTTTGTADFAVDRIWLANLDEGMGVLSSPPVSVATGLELIAFDTFYTAGSATMGTCTAPLGGNWDSAGDTEQWYEYAGDRTIRDAITADSSAYGGNFQVLDASATIAQVEIQADVYVQPQQGIPYEDVGDSMLTGVIARYVDVNNWLFACKDHYFQGSYEQTWVGLIKYLAGNPTEWWYLWSNTQSGVYHTLKLSVDTAGNAAVYMSEVGGALGPALISVSADAHLATGGALDDGKIGIYDAITYTPTPAIARYRMLKNFRASAPTGGLTVTDAVVYGGQSAQLTTDGHVRLDVGGTAYGPVSKRVGDLPRLPTAGLEGRTTEVMLVPNRGDFQNLESNGIDDISARIYYSPSWLTVPDT